MAKDTFDIKELSANIESYKEALSGMTNETARSADNIRTIENAMRGIAALQARMGEFKIIDPEQTKQVLKDVKDLEQQLLLLGVPYAKLLSIRKQEKEIISKEIDEMDKLLKKSERETDIIDELLNKSKKEGRYQERIQKYVKGKSRELGKYVSNMAGVQLSLMGIVALIIESLNSLRRISAMSKQIASQWGEGHQNLKGSASLIWEIRKGFKLTFEQSGNYLKSLSQAGFNLNQMKRLSTELLAVEYLQGQAVADQVSHIKDLVNNFMQSGDEAQTYLWTLREASKSLNKEDGVIMGMKEVVDATISLADMTKAYQGDLLGVLAVFNTLASKKIADRLGLGDMPLTLRKSIATTIASMSRDLEDGWKAALGRGATVAGRIIEFEKLLPEKQFERLAKFVTEKTSQFTGETQEIATRQLLKQLGFTTKEVQVVLARAFQKGAFSEAGLSGVMKEIAEQRKKYSDLQRKAHDQRGRLIEQGQSVAKNLVSLQTLLKQWVENEILPILRGILGVIRRYTGDDIEKKNKKLVNSMQNTQRTIQKVIAEKYIRPERKEAFEEFIRSAGILPKVRKLVLEKYSSDIRLAESRLGWQKTVPLITQKALLEVRRTDEERFKAIIREINENNVSKALDLIQGAFNQENMIDRTVRGAQQGVNAGMYRQISVGAKS